MHSADAREEYSFPSLVIMYSASSSLSKVSLLPPSHRHVISS
jgi:hypothetical protein